jgi:hypothetical protein
MSDTTAVTQTVDLYRRDNGEIIGTDANGYVNKSNLQKADVVAAINNAGASVYVNDTGYRDRVYINIDYDGCTGWDYESQEHSFGIDANLPTLHRLMRALQNEELYIVRSPDGKLTLASPNDDNQVEAEIEGDGLTYKVLKIIDDEEEDE